MDLSLFPTATIALLILAPLLFLSIKFVLQIHKSIPLSSLKGPIIIICLAPLFLQACNYGQLMIPIESGMAPLAALANKLYLALTFYCFYQLVREVIFFEKLLTMHDGEKAMPEFNDLLSAGSRSSMQALQSPHNS